MQALAEVSIATIVKILVKPLSRKIIDGEDNGSRYIHLLVRLYNDHNPQINQLFDRYLGGPTLTALRLLNATQAMLPTLPELAQMPAQSTEDQTRQQRRARVERRSIFCAAGCRLRLPLATMAWVPRHPKTIRWPTRLYATLCRECTH